MANAVKLRIRDPQDLYVPGDTISGELLLEISKGGLIVSKMMVCMKCIETCKLKSSGATEFDIWGPEYSMDLTSELETLRSCGIYKFSFNYMIDKLKTPLPPSASFKSLGDNVSGIRWYLEAVVELSNPRTWRQPAESLTDSMEIIFYPNSYVTCDTERIRSFEVENMNVSITIPEILQQAPSFWNIEITMMPLKPTMVHSVTVTLQTTVVHWDYETSRILNKDECIGRVDIGRILTKKLKLDGESQRWRASEFMTPAFTSFGANLCYTIFVSVLVSEPHKIGFALVDFVSPSLERCRKRQSVENKERQPQSPYYSLLSRK